MKNRVWKEKDPSFRRLLEEVAAEGDRFRANGQAWRSEGLGEWPLSRVLWRLAELGLPCGKPESFQEAFVVESPYAQASLWALRLRAEGELREFLEFASDVIWQWHFSNGPGPDSDFQLAADLAIESECCEDRRDKDLLRKSAEVALLVARDAAIVQPGDPPRWIAVMEARCRVPVSLWVADLVISLGAAGMAEEGIAVAEAWAPLALAERFEAELPILLATAGRTKEAEERARALLRDHPRSLSALFMAGEALVAMEKREEGYGILERAMALAESREERLWIRDHLTALAALIEEDRKKEPAPVFDDDESLDDLEVPAPLVADERIGRNDPCPCGSGKKYKKCCARGGA